MILIRQNLFAIACMSQELSAAHATSTVLASLWMSNLEIAADVEIDGFFLIKK